MDKEEIIRRLEKISEHAVYVAGEPPFIMSLDDGIALDEAARLLKEQEAVEPKTGHWLKKMPNYPSAIATGGSRTSVCDLCGGWGRKTLKYCPHCGAKMEEPTRT